MIKDSRPKWDEYFMRLALDVKTRSNCIRRQVGAIIVKDHRIITTGYSGTPTGIKNCFEGGCERCAKRDKNEVKSGEDKFSCICVHAEQNAILQAAYHGISTKDSWLYVTDIPCRECAKLIINSGIKKVIVLNGEKDELTLKLFMDAKIELLILK